MNMWPLPLFVAIEIETIGSDPEHRWNIKSLPLDPDDISR
jgi:hypothetical protein